MEIFLASEIYPRRAYKARSIFLPIGILLTAISGWLIPTIRGNFFFISIICFEEIIAKIISFDGIIQIYD